MPGRPNAHELSCPFCSTQVDPLRTAHVVVTEKGIVYLCSVSCRRSWLEAPTSVATLVQHATRSVSPPASPNALANVIPLRAPRQQEEIKDRVDTQPARSLIRELQPDSNWLWHCVLILAAFFCAWQMWSLSFHMFAAGLIVASALVRTLLAPRYLNGAWPRAHRTALRNGIALASEQTTLSLSQTTLLAWRKQVLLQDPSYHVERIHQVNGFDAAALLTAAACCEATVEATPIARAILRTATEHGISPSIARKSSFEPGAGVSATDAQGFSYTIGSRVFLLDHGFLIAAAEKAASKVEETGMTAVLVGIDGRVAGVLGLRQTPTLSAADAIASAKKTCARNVLYSADSAATTAALSAKMSFDEFKACIPEHQLEATLKQESAGDDHVTFVCFAQDAHQFAPSLTLIVTLAAKEATHRNDVVAIDSSDPRLVPLALQIAKTFRQEWLRGMSIFAGSWLVVLCSTFLFSQVAFCAALALLAFDVAENRRSVRLLRVLSYIPHESRR